MKLKFSNFTKFDSPLKFRLYTNPPGVGETLKGSGVYGDVGQNPPSFGGKFHKSLLH